MVYTLTIPTRTTRTTAYVFHPIKELGSEEQTRSMSDIWETQSQRAGLRSELERSIRRQQIATSILLLLMGSFVYLVYLCNVHLSGMFEENERYIYGLSRDFTGMKDFASSENGATVIQTMTTPFEVDSHPNEALSKSLNPGSCWRVQSQQSQVAILFQKPIRITHITVDHVSRYVVNHVADAPRDLRIWGLRKTDHIKDPGPKLHSSNSSAAMDKAYTDLLLGNIVYDNTNDINIQTFPIPLSDDHPAMHGVLVQILSNWGDPSTCLYRLRVHSTS